MLKHSRSLSTLCTALKFRTSWALQGLWVHPLWLQHPPPCPHGCITSVRQVGAPAPCCVDSSSFCTALPFQENGRDEEVPLVSSSRCISQQFLFTRCRQGQLIPVVWMSPKGRASSREAPRLCQRWAVVFLAALQDRFKREYKGILNAQMCSI